MNKRIIIVSLFLLATIGVSAQKLVGNISSLKGQKEVNLIIDYSETLVNGKEESKFIADETKGKSQAEKEQWLSEWNDKLRTDAYALLSKDLNKAVSEWFLVGNYENAEYSIIIKVRNITTGFFAGVVAKCSAVKADVSFVKTGSNTSFANIEIKKSSSKVSDIIPYFVTRIVMSFGTLGDDVGRIIKKNLKK